MTRVHRAVLFDLDGTLIDSLGDIASAMNAALREHGLPEHETDAYRTMIGEGARVLAMRAMGVAGVPGETDAARVDAVLASYVAHYQARYGEPARIYPGIAEVLESIAKSDVRCGVLSNKPDVATKAIVAATFPAFSFAVVFGERASVPRKPNPAGAHEAARLLGARTEDVAFVGDSAVDVETAHAAGMPFFGAGWGFRGPKELVDGGAQVVCASPAELGARLGAWLAHG